MLVRSGGCRRQGRIEPNGCYGEHACAHRRERRPHWPEVVEGMFGETQHAGHGVEKAVIPNELLAGIIGRSRGTAFVQRRASESGLFSATTSLLGPGPGIPPPRYFFCPASFITTYSIKLPLHFAQHGGDECRSSKLLLQCSVERVRSLHAHAFRSS